MDSINLMIHINYLLTIQQAFQDKTTMSVESELIQYIRSNYVKER